MYTEKDLRFLADKIESDDIRNFTHRVLDVAPKTFYTKPSSSSGKHHPPDETSGDGTILHTLRVIKVIHILAEMDNIPQDELDLLTSAGILHDSCAWGYKGTADHTVDEHDILVRKLCEKHGINNECKENILAIVECHMGRWGSKPFHCNLDLFSMLHIADMVASRRSIKIEV